jgi:hypothetical protein
MTEPRDRHWSSLLRPDNAELETCKIPTGGAERSMNYTEPETCDHQWVHKAGAGYRATPVSICVKCYAEKTYCAKCGEKL